MLSKSDQAGCTLVGVVLEPIVLVAEEATIAECARVLDRGAGAVVLDGEPLRTFTTRDVVRAVGSGVPPNTAISRLNGVAPVVLLDSSGLDAAVRLLLESPASCAIVEDAAGHLAGRLTLSNALRALLPQPAWVRGLQLALHIENATTLEVER